MTSMSGVRQPVSVSVPSPTADEHGGIAVGARERLLRAATELFYAQGVGASGIDAIIARASVAKMSLYNNFRNKDDLIAEVLRRRDQRWFEQLIACVEAKVEPRERLLAVFDFLISQSEDPGYRGCAFQMAAAELPDASHPGRKAILAHKHRFRQYLQRLCREASVSDKLADHFTLLADGAQAWRGMTGSSEPIKRAREAAELLLAAEVK